jgi:hypothetical protein
MLFPFFGFDKAGSNITGIFHKEYQNKTLMGRTTSPSIFTCALKTSFWSSLNASGIMT